MCRMNPKPFSSSSMILGCDKAGYAEKARTPGSEALVSTGRNVRAASLGIMVTVRMKISVFSVTIEEGGDRLQMYYGYGLFNALRQIGRIYTID